MICILQDARYEMEIGPGFDIWKLTGKVFNHPNFPDGHKIYTSTPVKFDEATNLLRTTSGRIYQIESYQKKNETVAQIKKDIKENGYEFH